MLKWVFIALSLGGILWFLAWLLVDGDFSFKEFIRGLNPFYFSSFEGTGAMLGMLAVFVPVVIYHELPPNARLWVDALHAKILSRF